LKGATDGEGFRAVRKQIVVLKKGDIKIITVAEECREQSLFGGDYS